MAGSVGDGFLGRDGNARSNKYISSHKKDVSSHMKDKQIKVRDDDLRK